MNLNKKIVSQLTKKKLRLAIAESCTGGMLSSSITSVNGASKVFTLGLVTYSNQAKINTLKVSKKIIQKHGSVSMQCCLAMINNLSKISKSNVCVSITGIAGPGGGSKQKPVGTVYFSIYKKISNEIEINNYKKNFNFKNRITIQNKSNEFLLQQLINVID